MSPPPVPDRPPRQASLDGLRGVAAVVVMLYHFTRRYGERFDADWSPAFSYNGEFGVLLFFMISGYVITLTTQRIRRPTDFLFFRFSRLYPTFWCCLAITVAVMLIAHFPTPLPRPVDVGVNATMLAKTLRRLPRMHHDPPYVDGAYWSLEIELFFYGVMFVLLCLRQTRRVVHVATVMVVLSAIDYWLAARSPVPSPVRWVLFFEYWPYFGIGIALFALKHNRQRTAATVLLAVSLARTFEGPIAGVDGAWTATAKILVSTVVFALAVFDRLPPLRWRAVTAIGAISYPLYLLHQNIGYVVLRGASVDHGVGATLAVAMAVVVTTLLAAVVSYGVEQPTLHGLRRLYRRATDRPIPPAVVSGLAPSVPITPTDQSDARR